VTGSVFQLKSSENPVFERPQTPSVSRRDVPLPACCSGPPSIEMSIRLAARCQPVIAPMPDWTLFGAGTSSVPC
jgi:hypothetical protein